MVSGKDLVVKTINNAVIPLIMDQFKKTMFGSVPVEARNEQEKEGDEKKKEAKEGTE